MTQYFDEEGKVHPATVVRVMPASVLREKNTEKDGYQAFVVGFGDQKAERINKPQKGLFGEKGNFRFVKEIPAVEGVNIGDTLDVSQFEKGDVIQVTGTSKGKGFQGVVKRHGFHGGRRSHGQKHSEREPGSIGAGGVQRVMKGMRMAGRMGTDTITVKNLEVVAVHNETKELVIRGALPGRKGTVLRVVQK